MTTEQCKMEFTEYKKAMIALIVALYGVDRMVIWEQFNLTSWPNPDADIAEMIGNLLWFMKDNMDVLGDIPVSAIGR